MPRRTFERIALSHLNVCAIAFATLMLAHAQAQYIPPPTPLPPPVFNPSNPSTVPQPPYRPIAPSTPSAVPDNVVTSPVRGRLPHTTVRSQRPTSTATRHVARHRERAVAVRATPASYSYYYSPFGYGYGCAWQRSWDGYWFRTSPCS